MSLPTMNIPDFSGAGVTINLTNSGRHAATDSAAVALSNEDKTALDALVTAANSVAPVPVSDSGSGEYKAIAASQTDSILGATGAVGDKLSHIVIIPATTTPGTVVIKDNTTTILTFPGGASSVGDLVPRTVALDIASVNGAFKITTGANVSVLAVGNFT